MENSLWCNYLSFGCEKIIESVGDCYVPHIMKFFSGCLLTTKVVFFRFGVSTIILVVYFHFSIILDILRLRSCEEIWI